MNETSKHVKNFLDKGNCVYLTEFLNDCKENGTGEYDSQCPKSWSVYRKPSLERVLEASLPKMELETGKKLFPTYSYARYYKKGEVLKCHTDRESCEISVTVMIGSCGESWPIYMDEKPIEMKPGDAVIYLGCDIWHERKPFTGDWHAQSFMHYVDKNGSYADEALDKRQFFCMPGVR